MKLLFTRSQALATLCYSSSTTTLLYDDHLAKAQKQEDIALPIINFASSSISSKENSLLFLGGFLQPEAAYQDYLSIATELGISQAKFYNYQKDNVEKLLEEITDDSSTISVLIGHSKGAKTLAGCMPFLTRSIPCVLIEPVDVTPPRLTTASNDNDDTKRNKYDHILTDVWNESNFEALSRVPTLIISAPYTDKSQRYGKATNLCAPVGYDAEAFYDAACRARRQQQQSSSTTATATAPLTFVEFPALGHNDIASTNLGGCAHGSDQTIGSKLVAARIVEWLQQQGNGLVTSALKEEEHSIWKSCTS